MTEYRSKKLSAYEQFKLLKLAEPVLPAVLSMSSHGRALKLSELPALLSTVSSTSDADSDALFDFCAGCSESTEDGSTWAPVSAETDFTGLMHLTVSVVFNNLMPYFTHKRFVAERSSFSENVYIPAQLPDKSDWFWRPLDDHMCHYESLVDGTLDLVDVARMNDVIAVREENQSRAHAAANKK